MLATAAIAFRFREPPRGEDGFAIDPFGRQLRECLAYLRQPFLRWLFAYMTLGVTLAHIPWEFGQPYLAAVFGESVSATRETPWVAGLMHATFGFAGAFAAGRSTAFQRRFGLGGTLLGVMVLQGVLIAAMAALIHPVVAGIMIFRSVQSAVSDVLVTAAVAPRVPQARRASYLSLHSLSGRLGYSLVLLGLSRLGAPGAEADPATLSTMLGASAAIGAIGVAILLLTATALRDRAPV
jgi:hypothetical protein